MKSLLIGLILFGTTMSRSCLAGGPAPVIIVQPIGIGVSLLGIATFEVVALSGTTMTYQWFKNGTAIPGATGANYTIANVQLSDQATYSVQIQNSGGTVTSSAAVLNIPNVLPLIGIQPQSQTLANGSDATLSVSASGTEPLSYHWSFNGNLLSQATNSTLTLSDLNTNDTGSYSVVVANSSGTTTSSVVSLTVVLPPIILSQPSSQSVGPGRKVTFGVAGNTASTYQWNFNGAPLAGATNSSLTLNSVQPGNAGNYSVVLTNIAGIVTSAVANLAVIPNFALSSVGGAGLGLNANGFTFQFSVPSGSSYVVLASTNFVNWTPIATNTTSSGNVNFTDPGALNTSGRYYRVMAL
jgi:hypothetical protein